MHFPHTGSVVIILNLHSLILVVADYFMMVEQVFWKLLCATFRTFLCLESQTLEILTHYSDLCLKLTCAEEYIWLGVLWRFSYGEKLFSIVVVLVLFEPLS